MIQSENPRSTYVWMESGDKWEPVVQIPLTPDEATTLCTILTALRPEHTFETSTLRPMSIQVPVRATPAERAAAQVRTLLQRDRPSIPGLSDDSVPDA